MTTEPTIYTIAAWNINKLNDKFAKINKRADRIGAPHVSYTIVAERDIPDPEYDHKHFPGDVIPKIHVIDITVEGQGPKIEGYRFVGTLDHNTLPGSVIVNTVPGEAVPPQYFHSAGVCDHCGKIRRRNETFVLLKEDDHTHTVIGRQCVRDFIGYDPAQVARYLQGLYKDIASLNDDEWTGGGSSGQWVFNKIDILKNTIAIIRTFGWVPRSAAQPETGRFASAEYVTELMYPARNDDQRKAKEALKAKLDFHPEEDAAEAEAAIEWLLKQPANNEYIHNLHNIANATDCPARLIGYWCSLVAAYQKAMETLRRNELVHKVNEWTGVVGEKLEAEVNVIGIQYIDGAYGTVALVRMLAETGHTMIWFANTKPQMNVGGKYKIKATVKKHDVRNEWKQTVLTRVKVL